MSLQIIIVGLGQVGRHLAKVLSRESHNVVGFEIDPRGKDGQRDRPAHQAERGDYLQRDQIFFIAKAENIAKIVELMGKSEGKLKSSSSPSSS